MRTYDFTPLWRSTVISKSGILALFALATLAWVGEDESNGAHSQALSETTVSATTDRSCNPHDPFSPCASATRFAVPVGNGLSVILIEDLL